ncbi:MAG: glycine--tRNA ligase [Planctomycetota bacterium]
MTADSQTVPVVPPQDKSMEKIVALCKRRGFIYPASEIYGGINGFWDYGPLGALLKNNLRDAWWRDMVLTPPDGPDGRPLQIVGLDSSIIQNPRAWVASGHVGGFSDPMVDCRETKQRYRADHVMVVRAAADGQMYAFMEGDDEQLAAARKKLGKYVKRDLADEETEVLPLMSLAKEDFARVVGPGTKEPGTLTEPRAFNLMFETFVGAIQDDDAKAYLRPETAQGIFLNYKNVVDTMRVRMPFGIAQVGKAFRNEVTPRNFIFRSREFEQMEMEWFCRPDEAHQWFDFWKNARYEWWKSVGVSGDNLIMRDHDSDELAHYAKEGAGTADVEYRYPFTAPGYGELEGVAHRSCFDLTQHQEHAGAKMEYFDQERNDRYVPHVIEPASGLSRGVLVLLCEAYTPDDSRASKVFMRFDPRMAPIKAAVYPLVNKDGMPEIASKLHAELRGRFGQRGLVEYDAKQNIGKRYARMDEAGCPFCFTVDGDTKDDNAVTVRHRDTQQQERIGLDAVSNWLGERLGL